MNEKINNVLKLQQDYFASGATLDVGHRLKYLKALYKSITNNIDMISEALNMDLGKSASESYMTEIGMVLSGLNYMIKNVKRLSKPRKCKTPLAQFHAKSYQIPSPYGNVLVMSPWNYPFLLSMDPLVEAIAAGNTVVLKPSKYSPYTSEAIKKIIEEIFKEEYVAVFFGGADVNQALIDSKFDYIFFTGGKTVGQIVYEKATKNLTPVTLELGGKSPCIIDKKCNLKLAARRIAWGKYLNCGQTCVAPDYILCDASVHDKFLELLKKEMIKQYTDNPINNQSYGKMINEKHFNRAIGIIDKDKLYYGGNYDNEKLKIEPTIMTNVTLDDAVMKEEIFAPILPVIKVNNIEEAISIIKKLEVPLAFYIFSNDKKLIKNLLIKMEFGGGCVNDVVMHLASSYLSFGGFKQSGMGSYHGKTGFTTFSHYKSILDKKNWIDMPMRYKPTSKLKDKLVRMFLK